MLVPRLTSTLAPPAPGHRAPPAPKLPCKRGRLVVWLHEKLGAALQSRAPRARDAVGAVWLDGGLLCVLAQKTTSARCPHPRHPNGHVAALKHGFRMVKAHLGVPSGFSDEEMEGGTLTTLMERRLVRYLCAVRRAVRRRERRQLVPEGVDGHGGRPSSSGSSESSSSASASSRPGSSGSSGRAARCVARGVGLFMATKGQVAVFYVYVRTAAVADLRVDMSGPSDSHGAFGVAVKSGAMSLRDDPAKAVVAIPVSFHVSINEVEVAEQDTPPPAPALDDAKVSVEVPAEAPAAVALPPNCTTSVRISYVDGTPENYEPPGFQPFGDETDFVGTPMKWTCGKVSTSFHTLTVKAKQVQQIETNSSETQIEGVVCPCGLKDNAGCLLKCESCGSLQHHACFKIFSSDGNSQSRSEGLHKCMKCSGFNSSDGFDSMNCVFRRVLFLCTKNKSLSIRKLILELGLSPESAKLNLRRLQTEGAVQKGVQPISLDKIEATYNVNKTTLINILKPKYFDK